MKTCIAAILLILLAVLVAAPVLSGPVGRKGRAARSPPPPVPPPSPRRWPHPLALAPAVPGRDVVGSFSIVSMFLRADIVVKAVMILLLLASLWSSDHHFQQADHSQQPQAQARKFEKCSGPASRWMMGSTFLPLHLSFFIHEDRRHLGHSRLAPA